MSPLVGLSCGTHRSGIWGGGGLRYCFIFRDVCGDLYAHSPPSEPNSMIFYSEQFLNSSGKKGCYGDFLLGRGGGRSSLPPPTLRIYFIIFPWENLHSERTVDAYTCLFIFLRPSESSYKKSKKNKSWAYILTFLGEKKIIVSTILGNYYKGFESSIICRPKGGKSTNTLT